MTAVLKAMRLKECSPDCVDDLHAHYRCERCSLPGMWGSIPVHLELVPEASCLPS